MHHSVVNAVRDAWPTNRSSGRRILLGVSGGADSVALLRVMCELVESKELLEVAHFNHRWRGNESDGDEEFVRRLCQEVDVGLRVGHAKKAEASFKTELAARELRYAFFAEVAYSTGASYVMTAHNANDRAETMLHNLFRGTGLAGVCSLTMTRPFDEQLLLVRPLLKVARQNILDYLQAIGQDYRTDSSNGDTAYRRNFLRHEVLPRIRGEYGEAVEDRLAAFSDAAAEMETFIDGLARKYGERSGVLEQKARRCGELPPADTDGVKLIVVPKQGILAEDWLVVRKWILLIWQSHGWPLADMSREKWLQIRDVWRKVTVATTSAQIEKKSTSFVQSDEQDQPHWRTHGNLPGNLSLRGNRSWVTIHPTNSKRK